MSYEAHTVLLSDTDESALLAMRLAPEDGPVPKYATLEELVSKQSLSSIDVLVVHYRPMPKGALLATLGRLNLEYPRMQRVAVLEGPLPLPVAEYLTACGVDMLLEERDDEAADRLVTVIDRLHERTRWVAS